MKLSFSVLLNSSTVLAHFWKRHQKGNYFLNFPTETSSSNFHRTIANYVMWRITGFSSYFLTEQLRKRQLQYSTAISGKQEQEPRWKECIDLASGSLSTGSGSLYVRKYFKKDSKAAALEMVNSIKEEFESILKTVPWMDDTTRAAALCKVKTMVTHIGYPDELMDDKKLIDFYKNITIDENKYLESILSINIFGTDRAFKKLREPVNKTDWITHSKPAVVNAFYSSIENSIRKFKTFVDLSSILHENFFRISGWNIARTIFLC